jgi:hypothetical protein
LSVAPSNKFLDSDVSFAEKEKLFQFLTKDQTIAKLGEIENQKLATKKENLLKNIQGRSSELGIITRVDNFIQELSSDLKESTSDESNNSGLIQNFQKLKMSLSLLVDYSVVPLEKKKAIRMISWCK